MPVCVSHFIYLSYDAGEDSWEPFELQGGLTSQS